MSKNLQIKNKLICGLFIASLMAQTIGLGNKAYAADTGGYPWSDATEINASTYDWGYNYCHPAMVAAQTCSTHYRYLMGVLYRLSDPWGYDVRNCTSFASWRANQAYGLNLVGWGNANTWGISGRASGYAVDSSPRYGDIAVWTGGAYGHVAFVYEVNSDGSVNVEQYNKAGRGEFSRQTSVRAQEYVHIAPVPAPVIAAPSTPVPVAAPVVEPIPISTVTVPVPVVDTPAITQVPEEDKVSYFVEKTPENGVKTIAVRQNNTKSGMVEVLTSDEKQDDSWSEPTVTEINVKKKVATSIALGDYNTDGINDMYEIAYSYTKSGMVEVSILDGKSDFKKVVATKVTKEKEHAEDEVLYDVADQNNDNTLDVLQIWHQNTVSGLMEIKVFDGMGNFESNTRTIVVPEQPRSSDTVYFMLGDHNGDSNIDLFEIIHDSSEEAKVKVKVFDIHETLAAPLSKWTTETDAYTGRGPNITL